MLAGRGTLRFVLSADVLGQRWTVPIFCLVSVYKCATKEEELLVFPFGFETHFRLLQEVRQVGFLETGIL